MRGIVNLFRCLKRIPDLLESRRKVWATDPLSEALAVAEQQGLELVHHDVGKETPGIEALAHRIADLREQSILDSGCLLGKRKLPRRVSTGPGPDTPPPIPLTGIPHESRADS